ncbi:MAG: S-methylmethionine-dependent homocysteine/selenocysteine methylase [Parasphingorhabdus sp.]|jgi:S-methylmethionine-dependent homocysteine/selenocysteine methylase
MLPYEKLIQRLAQGETILMDGATGTECERRGVPQMNNAWNGGGPISHPEVVLQVHRDYLDRGADIIITCTFGTSRHVTRDAGMEHQFEALTQQAVQLAKQARDESDRPDAVVVGGLTHWSWTGNDPSLEELYNNTTDQARLMADSGVDLLAIEMAIDIPRMNAQVDAARETGLPVWVGLTCKLDSDGEAVLRNGDSLAEALQELQSKQVPVVNIMHTDVHFIEPCLKVIQRHWLGYTGVYAHTGQFKDNHWVTQGVISPQGYAELAKGWVDQGARIIGGCCGMGPDHIDELKKIM